ncbi:hypothetical protein N5P37_008596 [Trichoderma harzianum]|nr:hypothetical protein N5P37_008596 [Trichoderma harzianum]
MPFEAALRPKGHHEYTVGWICALPKEQTAAIAMLDHRHADFQKPLNDPNNYTLGSINGHGIVIACLPKGITGTTSAATVAAWMVNSFPSIKVGLLVGIGGGVPPKVRLGDVVVSTPIGRFPGVVQWDFGKAKEGGKFERTGSLNNPPTPLLTALTRLETEHELNGSKIPEYLDQLKERWPRLASKYLRSDHHEDLLFRSDYQHVSENTNYTNFSGLEDSMPGAGKTILTSIVVDYLVSKFRHGDVGIAYIYCNFHRHHEQSTGDLLASILKQLAETQPLLPESVTDLYNSHQSRRTRPSVDELYKTLQSIIASYSRVFIIIDALDECQTSNNSRIKFLFKLFDIQGESHINIFATSRPIPEVQEKFKESAVIEVRAHTDDVKNYLESQISQSDSEFLNICREDIKTKITEAAEGMFHLAQLYFNIIKDKRTQKKIKDTLKELPIGRNTYDYTYEEAMKRIISQAPDTTELARVVLSWIVCAKRPLKALELQHALAVEPKKYRIDEENLLPIGDMASICAGLVTIEGNSGTVRLIHYTTHEYLERTMERWLPDAESVITTICTTYLLLDDFKTGPCKPCGEYSHNGIAYKTDCKYQKRLQSFPFYNYAANHWGHHARGCSKLDEEVINFLKRKSNVEASAQVLLGEPTYDSCSNFPREVTGLHLASYFGAVEAVNCMLPYEERVDPDSKDEYRRSALSYAVEHGHESIVKLLLSTGRVDPGSRDKYGKQPLLYAAIKGYEGIVKLLLATGKVDPDSRDNSYQTPLLSAAANGHEGIVKLLLATGKVNPNSHNECCTSALSYAAENGHEGIVKLLLVTGKVDLDSRDTYGDRPLLNAARYGHEDIVKLLLATGKINPDSHDGCYRSALSYAAEKGHEGIVKLLLATGKVDPDSRDEYGKQPLSYATKWQPDGIAKLLLATGKVDPNFMGKHGTHLHHAVYCGRGDIVELLLATGKVDPDQRSVSGETPLYMAAARGDANIVELLLAAGKVDLVAQHTADEHLEDNIIYQIKYTPLSIAIARADEAIFRLFVTADIPSINLIDADGKSPLTHAVIHQNEYFVEFLLAKDATSVNVADREGRTPLSHAAECGTRRIAKLILETGKVDRNTLGDAYNRTPLFYAAKSGHRNIVKLFLVIGIPIGYTYGYEQKKLRL